MTAIMRRSPKVRWSGPWWHRFHPRYARGRRLAMAHARQNANDPEHIARVNEAIRRVRAGESPPLTMDDIDQMLFPDENGSSSTPGAPS